MKENTTAKGLMWKTLESVGSQGINFLVQLFLARLLLPEEFGIIAILNVFINIANTFVNSGLASGLLQKKDASKIDFCTVFYVEIVISIVMYIAIYLCAPLVSSIYDNPNLTIYLRIFALTIILGALGSIQTTALRYSLDFRAMCIANFVALFMQGLTGVLFAINGFGVWSLILSQIVYRIVAFVCLWGFARWLPSFKFSYNSFKQLFSYSWKLFLGWLIGTVYVDMFSLIIGKAYDDRTLGFYSKGSSVPNVVNRIVTQTTTSVMFPTIAKVQDDHYKVKYQTRTMILLSSALVFPIMAGLAAVAEPFVMTVLTEKWAGAIPVIQIICISSAINVVSNANMQSINAIGRSDVFLKCEMLKRGITIVLVFVFAQINFYLMLFSLVLMGAFSLILNSIFNIRLLDYKLLEQARDILPYAVYSAVFFMIIYSINFVPVAYILKLIIQLCLCISIFVLSIFFIKLKAFLTLKEVVKNILMKRIKKG